MTTISDTTFAAEYSGNETLKKSKPSRFFFVAMAILFLVITFLGFFPSLQGMQEGSLEVHWLVHVHSAVMTGWLLLYILQTLLAATGYLRIHRRLGILSFVLAILVLIVMGLVSFHIVIANHPPEGSFLFDLLLFDFYDMIGFALFFAWGMGLRKRRPDAHKRLLTFATFMLLIAAVDRLQRNNSFPSLGLGYPTFSFIYMDVLLIPFFLYDLIQLKRMHKFTSIGIGIIIFFQVAVISLYGSPSWHRFWFHATAPFTEKVDEIKLTNDQSGPLLGEYESILGHLVITRSGDKLYAKFNEEDAQELGATSDTELFSKAETMTFSFVKYPDGRLKTAVMKQIGRIFKMTKVK